MGASELVLTTKSPSVQETLHARFNTMPIAAKPEGPVVGNVSSEYLKSNFII